MRVEDRQTRLKRIRMRSWRRGTKEMDMILGPFADTRLEGLTPGQLDLYERLLAENDQDLYAWVTRPADRPPDYADLVGTIADMAAGNGA